MLDYLKIVFGTYIGEGYGLTESTATASCTVFNNNKSGHVGFITDAVLLKLKDHKEMGYTSEDKPENYVDGKRVYRGEICLKCGAICKK